MLNHHDKMKGFRPFIALAYCLALFGCQSTQPHAEHVSELEQQILNDLQSKNRLKRMEAADRAAFYKFGSAAPAITRMLADDKSFLCGESFGHPDMCSAASTAHGALVALGSAAIDPLVLKLRDPRSDVRRRAMRILELIDDPRARDAVARAKR